MNRKDPSRLINRIMTNQEKQHFSTIIETPSGANIEWTRDALKMDKAVRYISCLWCVKEATYKSCYSRYKLGWKDITYTKISNIHFRYMHLYTCDSF